MEVYHYLTSFFKSQDTKLTPTCSKSLSLSIYIYFICCLLKPIPSFLALTAVPVLNAASLIISHKHSMLRLGGKGLPWFSFDSHQNQNFPSERQICTPRWVSDQVGTKTQHHRQSASTQTSQYQVSTSHDVIWCLGGAVRMGWFKGHLPLGWGFHIQRARNHLSSPLFLEYTCLVWLILSANGLCLMTVPSCKWIKRDLLQHFWRGSYHLKKLFHGLFSSDRLFPSPSLWIVVPVSPLLAAKPNIKTREKKGRKGEGGMGGRGGYVPRRGVME